MPQKPPRRKLSPKTSTSLQRFFRHYNKAVTSRLAQDELRIKSGFSPSREQNYNRAFFQMLSKSGGISKGLFKHARVLDVGTGGGMMAEAAQELGAKSVVGLDVSKDLAWHNKARGRLNQVMGLATKLPFQPGAFQVVTASGLLEHLSSPRRFVKEAARVLGPKGTLVLNVGERSTVHAWTPNKGVVEARKVLERHGLPVRYTPENIERLLEPYFEDIKVRDILPPELRGINDVVGHSYYVVTARRRK